jgi:2-methylcitrate dehydratase PrpD
VIHRLRGLVTLIADPEMDRRGCALTVELRSDAPIAVEIDRNRGTPANPLSSEELSAKFTTLSAGRIEPGNAEGALKAMWSIDQTTDVNELMELLTTK